MPLAFPKPSTAIRPASSLLEQIGNTPLLRLAKLDAEFPGIEIYAKAEFFNPGGSVKDRAGLNMILDGERTGRLTKDRILLDATSGNTGIAYAMISAIKGYRVKLCLPQNASHERKQIMKNYGAEMHCTSGMSRLNRRVFPMKVPLVPMQATKCVIAPLVCSMISTAVPSKWAFQLAGLLYWSG